MSPSLEQLKTAISVLPPPDRAELAHYLLHSLEPIEEGAAAEWRELAEQRMADVRDGRMTGIPADQIWSDIEGPRQ